VQRGVLRNRRLRRHVHHELYDDLSSRIVNRLYDLDLVVGGHEYINQHVHIQLSVHEQRNLSDWKFVHDLHAAPYDNPVLNVVKRNDDNHATLLDHDNGINEEYRVDD